MNKLLKILPLVLLFVAFGCEDDDERFGGDVTSGWVEFLDSSTVISDVVETVSIPVKINVPVFEDGLTVNYEIRAVDGDFEPYVFSSTGKLVADPDNVSDSESSGRNYILEVPLRNLAAERRFVTVFDIVLTSVEPFSVSVGVDGDSITSHRVTLECNAVTPANLESDFLVGDFVIDNGEEAAFGAVVGETVTITADADNPNIRRFTADLFAEGFTFDFVIELIDGVFVLQDIETPFSCDQGLDEDGEPNPSIPIVFSNGFQFNTAYDVCEDPDFLKIFIAEDLNNSCGGPVLGSFTLTRA